MKALTDTLGLLAAAAVLAASGCATPIDPQLAGQAAGLKVYEPGETASLKYSVVERIWVGTEHPKFFIPGQPRREDAVLALKVQALNKGADALVNLFCLDQGSFWSNAPSFICYANAIKRN